MAKPIVQIERATKRFGEIMAVDGVDLEITRGELFALLGGSGCGKTTLLRLLAGFEVPDAGRILIDGQDMTGVPPHLRPVNMMFQSYALFPHMSVSANIAYGLHREGLAKAEIRKRVGEMLALVKLGGLGYRKPAQLSGGQRQRVALARAIVKQPKLLLLDEPLAALDRKLREGTRFELMRLQEELGLTFVVVTHDQEEAMSIASRLAVMNAGRIVQTGTPHELYEQPASRFVADFIGIANIIDLKDGRWLVLRPEKIALSVERPAPEQAMEQAIAGTIADIAYEGDRTLYRVTVKNGPMMLVSRANTTRAREDGFTRGQAVWLGWRNDAGQVLTA